MDVEFNKEFVEVRIKRKEYREMKWKDIPFKEVAFENEDDNVVSTVNEFLENMLFIHNLVSPSDDHILEIRWNFRGSSPGNYVSSWITAKEE